MILTCFFCKLDAFATCFHFDRDDPAYKKVFDILITTSYIRTRSWSWPQQRQINPSGFNIEKCVRVKCRVGIAYGACLIRNQMDNTIQSYTTTYFAKKINYVNKLVETHMTAVYYKDLHRHDVRMTLWIGMALESLDSMLMWNEFLGYPFLRAVLWWLFS
jgi:hypothetical protein